MTCEKQLLVQAYFDDELDAAGVVDVEAHLETCAECHEWLVTLRKLRGGIREGMTSESASPALARAIGAALDRADAAVEPSPRGHPSAGRPSARRFRPFLAGTFSGAAAVAVAAALTVMVLLPGANERVLDEVASAHVRSMLANHLIDVASSNEHTVKPWFDGRVDIAPPVADFARDGFQLVGGRAEYIDGKRIPAVVYRKGGHVINLFIWRADGAQPDGLRERNGYHILTWQAGDLVYCAVSDIAPDQLRMLARLVQAEAAGGRAE